MLASNTPTSSVDPLCVLLLFDPHHLGTTFNIVMSPIPMIKRYRPEAGKPFPFPKSGSDWTLKELNFIGIDHKIDCALDEIIPSRIIPSPKITEFLVQKLSEPWEDLLTSEDKKDQESFYARLLHVAGPVSKGGHYDIPYTSSQLSGYTPPPEAEDPKTPEGDRTPMQPPRPSPKHIHPSEYFQLSPASPTPAKKTGKLAEATPQISPDPYYEWDSSPP